MREYLRLLSVAVLFAGAMAPIAYADERDDARSSGPIYVVAHFARDSGERSGPAFAAR